MLKNVLLIVCIVLVAGCKYMPSLDKMIPDRQTEYKKSKTLPDLEVPPDLTKYSENKSMAIPDERQATLSKYQRNRSAPAQVAQNTVSDTALDGHTVTVRGTGDEVWDKLSEFFKQKGYTFNIFDKQLGVLETNWSAPVTDAGVVYRYRFKVFSDTSGTPGTTLLYVSNSRQQQVHAQDGSSNWVASSKSNTMEGKFAGEIGSLFNGGSAAIASTAQRISGGSAAGHGSIKRAEVKSAGDGKLYLSIPDEFTLAWRDTETALHRAGFSVAGSDQAKGTYDITYFDNPGTKKKSWFSKLAFWKSNTPKGIPYKLSLTGVGDHTELVVLNEKGAWETNQDADQILSTLQHQYNAIKSH